MVQFTKAWDQVEPLSLFQHSRWTSLLDRKMRFSSMSAELVAIHEAFSFAKSLPNNKLLVILRISCCAIQRIVGLYAIDYIIYNIRSKAHSLPQLLRRVTKQYFMLEYLGMKELTAWLGMFTNRPLLYHVHRLVVVLTVMWANYL